MLRRVRVVVGALALAGCKAEGVRECEDLCSELVVNCGYEAYPSVASCEQGCLYEVEEEAEIEDHLECVLDAECDLFEIVECEHAYGMEAP